MLSSAPKNIEILVTSLLIDGRFTLAVQEGLKKYQIKQFKVEQLTPNEVFSLYYSLSTRFYCQTAEPNADSWYENELRIYIWLLVGYSYVKNKCISQMTHDDWQFFSQIFNNKSPEIFQFQARSIVRKLQRFVKWTEQEIYILDKVIKSKVIKNKWNQIAKQLFLQSDKQYFRTAKQCREYWINHLDPKPFKSEWTLGEDYDLIKTVRAIGKRWAKLSKVFHGTRTEHMVKNRFKSLFQLELRKFQNQDTQICSEDQILQSLQKRLASLKASQDKKIKNQGECTKLQQIKIEGKSQNFSSAEVELNDQDQEETKQKHNDFSLLLNFEENSNMIGDDELLNFQKFQNTTVNSFSNLKQCKTEQIKDNGIAESFNNFFDEDFRFN